MRNFIRGLVVIIALCMMGYAGYKLYGIMNDYRLADENYSNARKAFTSVPAASSVSDIKSPDIVSRYEDGPVPLAVDWSELQALNEEIIGWVYLEAEPDVSYPICYKKGDDDYYLHRSHLGEDLYAGAIFLEGLNNPDFSDPLSILYGHNMRNGSMFAKLKNYLSSETLERSPYFWVLTPHGNFRYKIISVLQTEPLSYVYTLFGENGEEFLKYEKTMMENSLVARDEMLYADDNCVLLSTCNSDHVHRTAVLGKCISTERPVKTTTDPVARTIDGANVEIPDEPVELQKNESVPTFGLE